MSRISEKLEHFSNDLMLDVGEERRMLIEEADKKIREENEIKEKEYISIAYDIIQDALTKIDQEKSAMMSKTVMDNRKRLLARRSELLNNLYTKVIAKLKEFKASEAYLDYLVKLIDDAVNEFGNKDISVSLDYTDRRLIPILEERTGYKVTTESKRVELLGGCKVYNIPNHVIIDYSFARKLEDARDEFVHRCKLEIE